MESRYVEFDRLDDSGFYAGPEANWIVWEICWKWDELKHFQRSFGRISQSENFFTVVDLFGANTILTVGGLSGELIEPENRLELKYPSGQPMEKSWQFLWQPNELSKQLINTDINVYQRNPERFFEFANAIFKASVSTKATDYGQAEVAVNQIPLRRLPGMVKKDLKWRLETMTQGDL
jgi:hypothetical protein